MHSWSARLPGAPRLSTRGLGPALPSCPGPRPAELIRANTHVLTSTQMHACTYKHIYAHTHTHTCTHAHMLTCMHTYILALWLQVGLANERTSRILEWGAKGRKKLGSCLSSIPSCQGWFGRAGLLTPGHSPPYPTLCPGSLQPLLGTHQKCKFSGPTTPTEPEAGLSGDSYALTFENHCPVSGSKDSTTRWPGLGPQLPLPL